MRILQKVFLSHHAVVLALLLVLSWLVLFGTSLDVSGRSYAGGLDHDAGTYVWYLWHLKQFLLGEGELLFSDRLFYPVGMNMVRQDWTPTTAALGLPFQWAGPLGAYNLEVLLAFVLCGYFTYLLALKLSGHRVYAFLAGLIFAFCEFRILKAGYHGHLTHVNQQFIPLFALFAVLYYRRPRWYYGAGAGLAFFLATFCTPYQMSFLLVFSVLFVGYKVLTRLLSWPPRLRWDRGKPMLRTSLAFTGLSAGTAMLLVSPLFMAMSWGAMSLGADSLSGFSLEFSADLLSYVMPTLGKELGWPNFSGEGGCAFQGYTVLALFAFSIFATVRWRVGVGFWIFSAMVFFLLSLGSVVVVGGKAGMELPFFKVLEQIPIIKGCRVASRYSVMMTLVVGVAASVALARAEERWLSRWRPWRLWLVRGAILLAVGYELLHYQVWMTTVQGLEPPVFPLPQIYRDLAREEQDSTILIYPLTWEVASDHLGPLHFPRGHYYYQTIHRKAFITGFGDAVPGTTLDYFRRLPFLRELVRIEAGKKEPAPGPRERAAARYLTELLDIRTIVVHHQVVSRTQQDAAQRSARALEYIRQALDTQPGPKQKGATVLKVPVNEASRPSLVEFALPASVAHLGSQWRRVVSPSGSWYAETTPLGRETETLYLRLPRVQARADTATAGGAHLELTLRCTHVAARLVPALNGEELEPFACETGWHTVKVKAEAEARRPGLNRLLLRSAQDLSDRALPLGSTGVSTAVRLQVISQGLSAGNRASIVVGALDRAANTRGYNVSVLDPTSGDVLISTVFDLVSDAEGEQAQRFVQLLHNVPRGMIVCLAVKDDGSIGLTEEVKEALRSIGARAKGPPLRASYAVIGVKGAKPGTALERESADSAATLELGSQLQLRKIRSVP